MHAKAQLDALARNDWPAVYDTFARSIYTEPATRHLARQFAAGCLALPEATSRSFFDADPLLNVGGVLAAIDCPVLVTHGTHDERVPVQSAMDYENALAHATLYTFSGKGHVPVFSAPEEFCHALREFVSAHETRLTSSASARARRSSQGASTA